MAGDEQIARVGSAAVREATGRGWDEWLSQLDDAGASAWDHQGIVAHLEVTHPGIGGWWRQSIAVAYEQARGMRVVGQTADAGFQLGVQRSVAADVAAVWETLTTRPELWLGEGASVAFDVGREYDVPSGEATPAATGEVRVVKPRDRVRLTWHPEGWAAPATVQLTTTVTASGKTALRCHLERLPDAATRDAMRGHWRAALDRVVDAVASADH
jgi:uncharacterized protein YndB with AHSA1/START domain